MPALRTLLRKHLRSGFPRRLTIGVMLISYALVMCGVPLPLVIPRIASEQAFPCQGHRCGCATASHCWQDCCCYSAAEKLAWAEQRGVIPSASFQRREPGLPEPEASSHRQEQDSGRHADADREDSRVMAVRALKCRGAGTDVVVVGRVLPAPVHLFDLSSPPTGEAADPYPGRPADNKDAPPSPPPRG